MLDTGHRARRTDAQRVAAYGDALRHSARVRLLKRAIPIGSILAVVGVMTVTLLRPFAALPGNVSVASVDLSGSKIVMELPKLQGFKKDSKPYEVKAATAAQDIRQPHLVELTELDAKLGMADDGWARLESPSGLYDSQKELLDLKGSVRVTTDTGMEARLRSAKVEFKPGIVRSDEPVRVEMKEGTVDADRLDILDNGKVVTFTGRVRTYFYGQDGAGGSPPGASPSGAASSGPSTSQAVARTAATEPELRR